MIELGAGILHDPQPVKYALDMSIDREPVEPQSIGLDASGRLHTDPGQAQQETLSGLSVEITQVLQGQVSASSGPHTSVDVIGVNSPQKLLQLDRALMLQAPGSQHALKIFDRSLHRLDPRGKALPQRA